MKYNLIYFDANQLEDYFYNQDYKDAYNKFLSQDDYGKSPYFVIFTGREKHNRLICLEIIEELNYIVEVEKESVNKIWVRGKNFDYKKYKNFNVINTQIVEQIADDKNKTYEYLKDLMPKSHIIHIENYNDVFNDIYVDRQDISKDTKLNYPYVIKPLDGLKGDGIIKVNNYNDIKTYFYNKDYEELFILQEFIECVDYEPLDIKGVHDIRLIIVNSAIVGLAVRQPKKDGWLCNVAQGGSIKVYDTKDIPTESLLIFNDFKDEVIRKLPQDFNEAIFSIDFCNTKDGFKIFELNSYPGIRLEYKTYIEKVKKLLNN
jgi:hypothetical protein